MSRKTYDQFDEFADPRDIVALKEENTHLHTEVKRLRAALAQIERVLGPEVPECLNNCEGCYTEWKEALRLCREALTTVSPSVTEEGQKE